MQTAEKLRPAPAGTLDKITADQLQRFDAARRAAHTLRHLEETLREHDAGHARRRARLVQEINVQRGEAEKGLREMAEILARLIPAGAR